MQAGYKATSIIIQAPFYFFLICILLVTYRSYNPVSTIYVIGVVSLLVTYKIFEKKSEKQGVRKKLFKLPVKILILISLISVGFIIFFHGIDVSCNRMKAYINQSFVVGRPVSRTIIPDNINISMLNDCIYMDFTRSASSGAIKFMKQQYNVDRTNWGAWVEKNIDKLHDCNTLDFLILDYPVKFFFKVKISRIGVIESISDPACYWD